MNETSNSAPQSIQIVTLPPPEDEISLRELWDRLVQGKWIIIIITILFLMLAVAYLAITPKIYESKAIIQIGHVAGEPIENGNLLAIRLNNEYHNISTKVTENNGYTSLTIVVHGKSPSQAQTFLQGILAKLAKDEEKTYKTMLQIRQSQLTHLEKLYQSINNQNKPKNGIKSGNTTSQVLELLAKTQQISSATKMLLAIAALQNKLSVIETYPSNVILQPTYDPISVQPKQLVIIIIALFVGLFSGILIVLLRESFAEKH